MRLVWFLAITLFAQDSGTLEGTLRNAATGEPDKRGSISVTLHGAPRPPITTTTDANGRFRIPGLEPGTYLVRAHAGEPEFRGRGAYQLRYVTVTAGERTPVNMQTVPRGAISGRVVDEEGDPVPYCALQAIVRQGAQAGMPQAVAGATTDDRGAYRLGKLAPGRYYVALLPRPRQPVRRPLLPGEQAFALSEVYVGTFYPDAVELASATPVTVEPGAEVGGIDFKLQLASTVRITGRTTGVDPAEISRSYVALEGDGPGMRIPASASAGRFSIEGVPPGSYTLVASAMVDKAEYQGSMRIQVGTRDIADLVLPLSGSMTIQGRVRGLDAQQLQGGSVYVAPYGRTHLPRAPRNAPINADGSFVITDVLPGRSQILVRLARSDYYRAGGTLNGQPIDPGDFELPPGSPGPLDIIVKTKFGSVNGTVDGAQPNGIVLLMPGKRRYSTMSDPDGSWKLERVEPGKYYAYAFSDCFDQCLGDVEPPPSTGEIVTVEEGGTHSLTLRATP